MNFVYYIAQIFIALLIAKATAPKPDSGKPAALEDLEVPVAEEGKEIPVVFGETTITGPNVVCYGDLWAQQHTKDGVKHYKYYMGIHFSLCNGPIDNFLKIMVEDKDAWSGNLTANQRLYIDKGDLFGKYTGGLKGYVDVMFGRANQGPNSYLTSKFNFGPHPNYVGTVSVVANQVYFGYDNPYPKPWSFRVKRILQGWDRNLTGSYIDFSSGLNNFDDSGAGATLTTEDVIIEV